MTQNFDLRESIKPEQPVGVPQHEPLHALFNPGYGLPEIIRDGNVQSAIAVNPDVHIYPPQPADRMKYSFPDALPAQFRDSTVGDAQVLSLNSTGDQLVAYQTNDGAYHVTVPRYLSGTTLTRDTDGRLIAHDGSTMVDESDAYNYHNLLGRVRESAQKMGPNNAYQPFANDVDAVLRQPINQFVTNYGRVIPQDIRSNLSTIYDADPVAFQSGEARLLAYQTGDGTSHITSWGDHVPMTLSADSTGQLIVHHMDGLVDPSVPPDAYDKLVGWSEANEYKKVVGQVLDSVGNFPQLADQAPDAAGGAIAKVLEAATHVHGV